MIVVCCRGADDFSVQSLDACKPHELVIMVTLAKDHEDELSLPLHGLMDVQFSD